MTQNRLRLRDLFDHYKKLPHQLAAIQELEELMLSSNATCLDRKNNWYETWAHAVSVKPQKWVITRRQISQVSGHNEALFDDAFMQDLNSLAYATGMLSVTQRRMLVAQTCHETGGYRWMKELGGPDYFARMYNNRSDLGNGPDDGPLYFGAGAIQLTGKFNYQRFSNWLKNQGMSDDRVMAEGANYVADRYPFLSAVCWIQENNWAAVCDKGDIYQSTRVLNGGYNGIDDRIKYYELACKYITE
jgi:predicted chitinase